MLTQMFLKKKKKPKFKYKCRVKQSHILLSTQIQRNEDIEPDISEDQNDDGDDGEQGQDDAVVDSDVEEEEWTVAEEVEERPRDEDGEEGDHGDPMPKEVEDEDEERDERVVHVEVIEVALDASGGFAECVREHEGGEWLDELAPWTARGEDRARGGGIGGGCGCGGKCVVVAW